MPKQDTELEEILLDSQTHYERVCLNCGNTWLGLHCPHDGYQNNCPSCNIRPHTAVGPKYGCTCNGTVDLDDLKDLLLAWRDKSVNEALEEMFDEIVALASTKTFNNWTNKDASNFFFALGKYIREHKAHLNKKGEE